MHELGVVFYVVKDVKKVAEENHVEKVSSVTLEIGEVSGILHDYLTDCWNWAKKNLATPGLFIMPESPASDSLPAAAVGIVSGLAATGINQVYKQLTKEG